MKRRCGWTRLLYIAPQLTFCYLSVDRAISVSCFFVSWRARCEVSLFFRSKWYPGYESRALIFLDLIPPGEGPASCPRCETHHRHSKGGWLAMERRKRGFLPLERCCDVQGEQSDKVNAAFAEHLCFSVLSFRWPYGSVLFARFSSHA